MRRRRERQFRRTRPTPGARKRRALGPAAIGQFADDRRSYQLAFQAAAVVLMLSAVGMVVLLARANPRIRPGHHAET